MRRLLGFTRPVGCSNASWFNPKGSVLVSSNNDCQQSWKRESRNSDARSSRTRSTPAKPEEFYLAFPFSVKPISECGLTAALKTPKFPSSFFKLSRRFSHWGSRRPHFHFAKAGGFLFSEMSLRLLTLVWEKAPYKDGALLLLLALADFSNDQGLSWPAVDTVANKARMGERHARRLLRQFEDDGIVKTDLRGDEHQPNCYRISVDKLEAFPTRTICPPSARGTPRSENVDADVHEGGYGGPRRGTPVAPQPSGTVIEPSLNRKSVELPLVPLLLNTPDFEEAWSDWKTYRKDRKMALTPTTAKVQLQKLESWGTPKAIQAIRDSIANNWQGFFEPRDNQRNGMRPPPGGFAPLAPMQR